MPYKDVQKRRSYNIRYQKRRYQNDPGAFRERNKKRCAEIVEWIRSLKVACVCGEDHPACLDFHHRDEAEKVISIADAAKQGWSKQRILAEITKCDVTCSNCHRKHHFAGSFSGRTAAFEAAYIGSNPVPAAN